MKITALFYSSYGVCLNMRGEGVGNGKSLKATFTKPWEILSGIN